jgi:hypothetical protein
MRQGSVAAGWVFHANPDKYDIDACLREEQPSDMDWLVTRYGDEMGMGDTAFLWRSGQTAGVICRAELTGPISPHRRDLPGRRHWKEPAPEGPWAPVRLMEFDLDTYIDRYWLKHDPLFFESELIRARQPTNFAMSIEQLSWLAGLWSRRTVPYGNDDYLAALWAYCACGDERPFVSSPPVIQASRAVMRPVTWIREIAARFRALDRARGETAQPIEVVQAWRSYVDERGALDRDRVRANWQRGADSGRHSLIG